MLVLSTHVARQTSVGISKMHCKHSDVMPCCDMSGQGPTYLLLKGDINPNRNGTQLPLILCIQDACAASAHCVEVQLQVLSFNFSLL